MMGAYGNDSIKRNAPPPAGRASPSRAGPAAATICLLASLLAATVTGAETPSAPAQPTASPDLPVSTSPEPKGAREADRGAPGQTGPGSTRELPLTRAAARQRVESLSPLPWLSRFGPVAVEQADPRAE